jgi:hypothetical protein
VGIIRYRSRRDFIEMMVSVTELGVLEVRDKIYKVAPALLQKPTFVIPLPVVVMLVSLLISFLI